MQSHEEKFSKFSKYCAWILREKEDSEFYFLKGKMYDQIPRCKFQISEERIYEDYD